MSKNSKEYIRLYMREYRKIKISSRVYMEEWRDIRYALPYPQYKEMRRVGYSKKGIVKKVVKSVIDAE